MQLVGQFYEALNRMNGGQNMQWGRGVTPYSLSRHMGCGQKKARQMLDEFVLYNLAWSSKRPYGRNRTTTRYYLNGFGRQVLKIYYHASDSERSEGQMVMEGFELPDHQCVP